MTPEAKSSKFISLVFWYLYIFLTQLCICSPVKKKRKKEASRASEFCFIRFALWSPKPYERLGLKLLDFQIKIASSLFSLLFLFFLEKQIACCIAPSLNTPAKNLKAVQDELIMIKQRYQAWLSTFWFLNLAIDPMPKKKKNFHVSSDLTIQKPVVIIYFSSFFFYK